MTYIDFIGTLGVAIILAAYFLQTNNWIPSRSVLYFLLNTAGAALACYASFLLRYWPFVVLEGAWTVVSLYGWLRISRRD